MAVSDIIIIFFACGSPFAVHYFLRTRQKVSVRKVLFTLALFIFWPAYAIWLTNRYVGKIKNENPYSRGSSVLDARAEKRIDGIRTEIENILRISVPKKNVFDSREIFDRYVGLTLTLKTDEIDRSSELAEMLKDTRRNVELTAVCLRRRNRRLLLKHQTEARIDFLHLVSAELETDAVNAGLGHLAIELAVLVCDPDAGQKLERLLVRARQNEIESSVNDMDTEVWRSPAQEPTAVNQI